MWSLSVTHSIAKETKLKREEHLDHANNRLSMKKNIGNVFGDVEKKLNGYEALVDCYIT